MKRIEMNIERCEQCPFLLLDHKNMISGCHKTEQDIWVIDNINLIPDWCPLPDVDGDYTCPECNKTYNNLQMAVSCCYKGDGLIPIE